MLKVHILLLLRCCIAALIVALSAGRIAAIYFCLNNKWCNFLFSCLRGFFVLCKPHFVVVSLWTSERHPNHNRHFVANQTCEYSVHHSGETSVWQCLPYEFTLTCPSGPVSLNLTCLDGSQLGSLTLSFILITIVLFRLSPSGQVCWKLTCLEAECTRHGQADECLDITRFAKQQDVCPVHRTRND